MVCREVTDEHIDLGLKINPSLICCLKEDQLTEKRVIDVVTMMPSLIKTLGEKFNIYSSALAQYAFLINSKLPIIDQEAGINAINEYQSIVNKTNEAKDKPKANDTGYVKALKEKTILYS